MYFTKTEFAYSQYEGYWDYILESMKDRTYDIAKQQERGDCQNSRYILLNHIHYDKQNKLVSSGKFNEKDGSNLNWTTIFPDSIGESQLNYACYIAGYRTSP